MVLEFKDLEGKPSVPGQKPAPQQQQNKQPLPAVQQTTNNNLFRKSTSASRSLSVSWFVFLLVFFSLTFSFTIR